MGASILEKTGEGDESYGIYMEGKVGNCGKEKEKTVFLFLIQLLN